MDSSQSLIESELKKEREIEREREKEREREMRITQAKMFTFFLRLNRKAGLWFQKSQNLFWFLLSKFAKAKGSQVIKNYGTGKKKSSELLHVLGTYLHSLLSLSLSLSLSFSFSLSRSSFISLSNLSCYDLVLIPDSRP